MAATVATLLLALRAGLAVRRARLGARPRSPALRRRHLRLAKAGVTAAALGFVGGPASMVWLRGREPFDTVHGLLGGLALLLFATTAVLGRRLERARGNPRTAHALCGLLAILAACAAAMAGLVLLP